MIKVSTSRSTVAEEEVQRHVDENIKGRAVVFSDENLRDMSDMDRIRKVYKISLPATVGKPGKPGKPPTHVVNGDAPKTPFPDELKSIETQILGAMALRGAA